MRTHRGREHERPVELDGVGVDQQLGGIEEEPAVGIERAFGAKAIAHALVEPGDEGVMDVALALHRHPAEFRAALGVEQAEREAAGVMGLDSEVNARRIGVERRPETPGRRARRWGTLWRHALSTSTSDRNSAA